MAAEPLRIFFDLDGTLIDVSLRHHEVYSEIVIALGGQPLNKDAYWQHKRAKEAWPVILNLSGLSPDSSPEFLDRFIAKIENPKYLRLDSLLPGAAEVLREFSGKSECYLVSLRRNPENLKQEVRHLGLSKYFRKILTGHSESDGSDKKSELIKAELDDRDALIIGDTEADIKAGKILGVTTVAVLSGIRSEKFLKSVSPDYMIRSIGELPSLFISLCGSHAK